MCQTTPFYPYMVKIGTDAKTQKSLYCRVRLAKIYFLWTLQLSPRMAHTARVVLISVPIIQRL
jgi:hypothetical protein